MGYIDVAIPGVIGLLLVMAPGLFTKATAPETTRKLRLMGMVLLGVAALYLFIKLVSPSATPG